MFLNFTKKSSRSTASTAYLKDVVGISAVPEQTKEGKTILRFLKSFYLNVSILFFLELQ